jgi:hypothetical protein
MRSSGSPASTSMPGSKAGDCQRMRPVTCAARSSCRQARTLPCATTVTGSVSLRTVCTATSGSGMSTLRASRGLRLPIMTKATAAPAAMISRGRARAITRGIGEVSSVAGCESWRRCRRCWSPLLRTEASNGLERRHYATRSGTQCAALAENASGRCGLIGTLRGRQHSSDESPRSHARSQECPAGAPSRSRA